ncbi:unnamed protein product, partial [Mesorhabditis belari]|uniref:Skp1-related protein n=1 Tax=Mesorhabditis belari TaxID=2138241 RepID=A0AAF3J5W2_9BILA
MQDETFYKVATINGRQFTLSKKAAELSTTLVNVIQAYDLLTDEAIARMEPIQLAVESEHFHFVQKWLETHRDAPPFKDETEVWEDLTEPDLLKWEAGFFADLLDEQLFHIFKASNYLDIKSLQTKCAKAIAAMITGKSETQIYEIWGLSRNVFSAQEQANYRLGNPWEAILQNMATQK